MNLKLYLYNKLKRKTSSGNFIPEIDGLRFLAVMVVILYHIQLFFVAKTHSVYNYENVLYDLFNNGFKGVEIFFIISGFILALPFVKYFLADGKKPNLKSYYYRRLSRLEPPYFIALLIFFTLHVIKGVYPLGDLVNGLFFNLAYLQNFAWLEIQPMIGNITWTLEVEVQFYLVAPILASVFYIDKFKRRLLLIVAILGIPIVNVFLVSQHISLYNYLFYFLVGFLIADLYITEEKYQLNDKLALFVGMLSFSVLYIIDIVPLFNKLVFVTLLFVFIYIVLTSSIWRRIFSNKLFTTIGGMCYTIYLFHTVVISGFGNTTVFWNISSNYELNILLQTIILIVPILVISAIYFILVEKPCMNRNWPYELSAKIKLNYKKIIRKLSKFKINLLHMDKTKTALVCGAGGFIGGHLVKRLKKEGYWVRGVDLKQHEFAKTQADDFVVGDLRDPKVCEQVLDKPFDEVYQLAADMGGAGFVFVGDNDADIMHNSALINLNIAKRASDMKVGKIFYSSSACMYPEFNQEDPDNPKCGEDTAYPAQPDSEYGWEKLFSERFYLACAKNYGLNVRIARFHNIFGPEGTWKGGREKAPAAFCRKVSEVPDGGEIEMWGDGKQTRSFLYIDECLEAVRRLMDSDFKEPVNIGSEEMVTINQLADMTAEIAGKKLSIKHIDGPQGVRGRNSDNTLFEEKMGWKPSQPLVEGIRKTYQWVDEQAKNKS